MCSGGNGGDGVWERTEEAFVMQRELSQAVADLTSVSISPERSLRLHPHTERQFVALTHTRTHTRLRTRSDCPNKSCTFAN